MCPVRSVTYVPGPYRPRITRPPARPRPRPPAPHPFVPPPSTLSPGRSWRRYDVSPMRIEVVFDAQCPDGVGPHAGAVHGQDRVEHEVELVAGGDLGADGRVDNVVALARNVGKPDGAHDRLLEGDGCR